MKKYVVLFILVAIFSMNLCFASENIEVLLNKELKVLYNGQIQEFQNVGAKRVYPISYEGTTYLPIRSISCLFDIAIKWDGTTQSIYLGEGDKGNIVAKNANSFVPQKSETVTASLNQEIRIYYNSKLQLFTDVDGKVVYPISYNGTTYLPVRAVSNLFGLNIDYNAESYSVLIRKNLNTDEANNVENIISDLPKESFANSAERHTTSFACINQAGIVYSRDNSPIYLRLKNIYSGDIANKIVEKYNEKSSTFSLPYTMNNKDNKLYCAIFDVDLKDYTLYGSNTYMSTAFLRHPTIKVFDLKSDVSSIVKYSETLSAESTKFSFNKGELTQIYVVFELEKDIELTAIYFDFYNHNDSTYERFFKSYL